MEEDLDLIIDNDDKKSYEGKRPQFLTVLCILTYVGSGLAIFAGIIGILMMGAMETLTSNLSDMSDLSNTTGPDLENMYRWTKISQILALIGAVLCLVGALVMWNLKKNGFYIYVFGQIIPLIGSFMTMNSVFSSSPFAGFGVFAMIIGSMFPLAFIIMYGINLKHME